LPALPVKQSQAAERDGGRLEGEEGAGRRVGRRRPDRSIPGKALFIDYCKSLYQHQMVDCFFINFLTSNQNTDCCMKKIT
jgi:hypothetical protein